jgi:hypothetical protein
VVKIIEIFYKGGNFRNNLLIELNIVQDADRLDALGAMELRERSIMADSRIERSMTPNCPKTRR